MPSKKCSSCYYEWNGGCPHYDRWIDPCPDYVTDISYERGRQQRKGVLKALLKDAEELDDPETPQ